MFRYFLIIEISAGLVVIPACEAPSLACSPNPSEMGLGWRVWPGQGQRCGLWTLGGEIECVIVTNLKGPSAHSCNAD